MGLTTVIMVLLMGLSRVVLAMSRDGLLPRSLSKTSEKRSTPVRLQIICGAAVALVAGLTNVDLLEEMINIGTLSAFVMVSLGILVLRKKRPDLKPAFRVPFGKVLPVVSAVLCLYLMTNLAVETWIFFASGWSWAWRSTSPTGSGTPASTRSSPVPKPLWTARPGPSGATRTTTGTS